jgi:hypothetical protein
MTRRRIIFRDKTMGILYSTPEFNGDKAEFEQFYGNQQHRDSCDKDWNDILQERFAGVKTLKDFITASDAAQLDYHSFLGVEVLPVEQIKNAGVITADEIYEVTEHRGIRKLPTAAECDRFNNALQAYFDIDSDSGLEKNKITYAEYQAMGLILDCLRFDGKVNVIQEGIKNFFELYGMTIEQDANGIGWTITW